MTVNYTLALVITTLMVSGLFLGMNTLLENERREALRSEFAVLGNRITADLAAADRLAQTVSGPDQRVTVSTTIPDTVAGQKYTMTVVSDGVDADGDPAVEYYDVTVYLDSKGLGVNRSISLRTVTPVAYSRLPGGDYEIVYDGTDMEVQND